MKLHELSNDLPGDKTIWIWKALSQPVAWGDFESYRVGSKRPSLDSPFQALALLSKLEATDDQWMKALEYFTDSLYRLNLPERASFARQALNGRGLQIALSPQQAQRILRNPSGDRDGQFFPLPIKYLNPPYQFMNLSESI